MAAARLKIKEISDRKKLPVIVGGTGLYISALLDNTEFINEQTDLELRKELENRFDTVGAEKMLEELSTFDPETAKRLHPNDRRRIIRAFEVYKTTGKSITWQNENSHSGESEISSLVIGITYENREKLYERINKRVDLMLANGLLQEAQTAFERADSSGGFQAIGHKELYGYLKGESSLEESVDFLKMQTRRYAKRQLTWFRRDERINWLYADKDNVIALAEELVENFVKE